MEVMNLRPVVIVVLAVLRGLLMGLLVPEGANRKERCCGEISKRGASCASYYRRDPKIGETTPF